MDKYGKDLSFDAMDSSMAKPGGKHGAVSMDAEAIAALSVAKMRCGGCGSKACSCQYPTDMQCSCVCNADAQPSWLC